MCGRYIFYDGKKQKIRQLIELAEEKLDPKIMNKVAVNDVYPGNDAFVGVRDGNGLHTHIMQWGYASDHGLVINARSETVFTSRFFAGSIPCIAIASAYYEWSADHVKYTFGIEDKPLYLASIARKENDIMHYVILTEEARGDCRRIHPRQPVIFTYENAKKWCAGHTTSLLKDSLQNRMYQAA